MSAEVENEKSPPSPGRLSWLKPKQSEKRDSASFVSAGAPASVDVRVAAPAEENLQPISFFGLFRSVHLRPFLHAFFTLSPLRYSTRVELIVNGISIIAAVAAGASQVPYIFFFFMSPFPTNGYFRSPS